VSVQTLFQCFSFFMHSYDITNTHQKGVLFGELTGIFFVVTS